VTRYSPLWQQANSYAASLDRALISLLTPAGAGSTGGAVTVVSGTMNVSVAPGTAIVALQAGQGAALCRWDAAEVVTLAAAPPSGQSRVDLIVAQVRDNALDAGGNNDFIFTAVTGTPAASNPATPAVPTNAYPMAQVLVPGAAANLNTATITDRRIPLGPPNARVYLAASGISVPNGAPGLLIPFDTVDWDPWRLWNAATHVFTAQWAGRWQFSGRAEVTSGGLSYRASVELWVNGAQARRGADSNQTTNVNYANSITQMLNLNAGDTVALNIFQTSGAAQTMNPNAVFSTFEAIYIGGR
jgi:hypothetical protein